MVNLAMPNGGNDRGNAALTPPAAASMRPSAGGEASFFADPLQGMVMRRHLYFPERERDFVK